MNVDRRRDGLERGVLVADGHELDELHAVGVALGGAARELDADRRLADAARADERDETVLVEGGSEALEERLPADERLQRGGEHRLLAAVAPAHRLRKRAPRASPRSRGTRSPCHGRSG